MNTNELIKDQLNQFTNQVNYSMVNLWRYGVKIDHIQHGVGEDEKTHTFFISVPKSSHLTLDNGEEAAGMNLARYAKETFIAINRDGTRDFITNVLGDNTLIPNQEDLITYIVKAKVREEYWDREKEELATLVAMEAAMMLNSKNKEKF